MEFSVQPLGIYIRVVAIISLLLGLNDAARLLGVNLGDVSPLETLGVSGFVFLAIFAMARLFASVGLWIHASWGAVLLVASTTAELALYLVGNADVRMSMLGFGIRLVLLAAIIAIFVLSTRIHRARTAD